MTTVTKAQLIQLATSTSPVDREKAREIYQLWVKAAPQLEVIDRLSATERMILSQIFKSNERGPKRK